MCWMALIPQQWCDKRCLSRVPSQRKMYRRLAENSRKGTDDVVFTPHVISLLWNMWIVTRMRITTPIVTLQGYTAMAKTVGYPCAIATKMVLDGEIQRSGMVNNGDYNITIIHLKGCHGFIWKCSGAALHSRYLQTHAHSSQGRGNHCNWEIHLLKLK